MGIISWYEGDNDYPAARKAKMKALSVKWLALLNEEHADGNFSGTQKLYETLRMKHKEDGAQAYPSRSFVNDFLQRQFNEQRFKRTKKSDTIQAIVSSRPLQMIQVDYLYFITRVAVSKTQGSKGRLRKLMLKPGRKTRHSRKRKRKCLLYSKKGNIQGPATAVVLWPWTHFAVS